MTARRFPAPCTVGEYRGISFIIFVHSIIPLLAY